MPLLMLLLLLFVRLLAALHVKRNGALNKEPAVHQVAPIFFSLSFPPSHRSNRLGFRYRVTLQPVAFLLPRGISTGERFVRINR
uniref:Putative secreted peptide n=1 Tax=Anopheles braziliensis TaxID=58242 RepID=A0A2M3ZWF5_9DIPT